MADSRIEWTDATWNPVVGCTRASEGCDNCYAVTMTKRLEAMGQEKYSGLVNLGKNHFNGVVKCHEDALLIPLRWKKPRMCFVNSMSDLFHKDVPFEFIDKVFAVMALTPHITYQVLTKRPERMAEYLSHLTAARFDDIMLAFLNASGIDSSRCWGGVYQCRQQRENDLFGWPLPNVWLGTSVENQEAADERIPHLLRCPAAVRFLSCEPLIGGVDLTKVAPQDANDNEKKEGVIESWLDALSGQWVFDHEIYEAAARCGSQIDWVIVGGESGPNARPMHPDWARSLRDQCVAAGVPFFFKQWGAYAPDGTARGGLVLVSPSGGLRSPRVGALAPEGSVTMAKTGKHRAGRLLDGREWNEFPGVANA